ncbi:MAG: TonB-dependent receptor [Pseudoxanthomonas sp.]
MRIATLPSCLCLALFAQGLSVYSAHAQTTESPGITGYAHEYFVATSPSNARDMVERLPGFTVVESDADVRGYAAAQGNVLIDGARPSSKHVDIGELLKRIPAASVDRIELIRSGAPGIDMGGFAVLANVIRKRGANTESAIEFGGVASTDGWTAPLAQLEYGRRWDSRALDLAVKFEPELDDDSGRGTIRSFDPQGTLLESAALDTRTVKRNGEASASWRQPLAGGRFTLTTAMRGERARTDTQITALLPGSDNEVVAEDEDLTQAEIGARFVRTLGTHSTLEMMASQQLGWLDSLERSMEGGDEESFEEKTDTGESIARIDLTHEWSGQLSFATSLEGAFNFLESNAALVENGNPVLLPGSEVRIEETRVEVAAGATWKPAAQWVLEAGMRVENSSITQTGDTPLERRFTYPKPRIAVRWDADDHNQLRLTLSREVGQLDFADFVASASLDSGLVSAGNAELEPDKTWRMVTAWEHHFWTDAAFTASWTHDRITDVVDRVLVTTTDDVFDAPGNIGAGRRDTLTIELSAPLDRFGFSGAQLRSAMLWRRSRVTDPVTGESRGISEEKPVEASIELTQDLPAWRFNWGLQVEHIAERKTKYRYDEVRNESEGTGWTLFAERRIGEHWRMRAEATDLFGRDFKETRDKYDGPLSTRAIDEIERRNHQTPGYFSLTFRRSMGG